MTASTLPHTAAGRSALEVARDCARAGARLARDGYRLPRLAGVKGRGNIVTQTDFAVESRIIEVLGSEFPEHRVLSEETRPDTDAAGWVWVIDPIDGTKNFSIGIPIFCRRPPPRPRGRRPDHGPRRRARRPLHRQHPRRQPGGACRLPSPDQGHRLARRLVAVAS